MEEIELFVPGRVGVIGEISDLVSPYLSMNKKLIPGHAIAFPIDKGIYSKVKKSNKFKYKNKDKYFECEITEERLTEEIENNSFYSYMCGTILYMIRKYKVSGIELEIKKNDLPIKKGLSSSAAICITVAKAYNELYNLNLNKEDIKEIAYEGEHLAKSNCGYLDQESIMNDGISHIIFEKKAKSERITVKENVYILIVDLNKGKNTKEILKTFNDALPEAKNDNDKIIHDVIGEKNKKLVYEAIKNLETGNIKKLGENLNEAQALMDKVGKICEELKAPTYHKLIEDNEVKKMVYGGKSCGSGGDGTVLLICKDKKSQEELAKYIEQKYNMKSIITHIKKSKKKITIIGAGPAGLTCAYYLLKNDNNYDVTILEQENQVGGISKTIDFYGNKMDTGIHRFFTKNKEVQKIWEEILPIQSKPAYDDILLQREKKYPQNGSNPEEDEKSFLIRDRITRIYYGRKFYDYPVSLNFTTLKNMGFLNVIKVGFSYIKACLIKREENSLEDFYINKFGKKLYSMFFESYTEKVWGIHPSKISADWGAQRVKGISIMAIIKDMVKKALGKKSNENTETSLIEQFIYPKLGAGQIYEEMAKEIEKMGGKIYFNSRVTNLSLKESKIKKIFYKHENQEKEIDTDICISSMPIKDLINGIKEDVPKDIVDIATNLPYREFISVGLIVKKLQLKNNTNIKTLGNIIPDSWIYVQEPDVKLGRVQIFNNWSPYIFKEKEDIKNKVFISLEYFCSEGDDYWNMPNDKFIKFAEKEAIKIGLIEENSVEQSIEIKIKKAYPAYFGTYKDFEKVVKYVNNINNLFCIGRNGQHRYNNMDHAMLTGIEVAKNIINNKTNKDNIWEVNTEKEYHETIGEKDNA